MRKYDIPYVQRGPATYYPVIPLEDMSVKEIVDKYIKTCAKANGQVSACSKCQSPCKEGKRAIQLLANQVYNNPPVPLYGGKTLIEKAREQNMERRKQMDEEKVEANAEEKPQKRERGRRPEVPFDGWYEVAMNSGDPFKWLMTEMGITKTQAKKKIYQYRYRAGLTGDGNKSIIEKHEDQKEEVEPVETKEEVKPVEKPAENSIEAKLEMLMKQQEKHKKKMDEYMELFKKEKEEYDKIKQKTDILCNAMDILND